MANLGNVTGLIRSQTAPTKKYVVWAKIINPTYPDIVELNYWDGVALAWTPLTEPTTQHWLRPVLSNTLATPPSSPAEEDRYLIPASPSGVWVGKTDQVATWRNAAWVYQIPLDGFIVSVRTDANKLYDYRGVYAGGGVWAVNDFQVPVAPGTYLLSTEKGQPLGVCNLDENGQITASRLNYQTLPYTPLAPGNWPGGVNTVAEALNHLILNIGAVAGSVNMVRNIPQTAHGFSVGNVLTVNGSGVYVKISNPSTQKPVGIISVVTDANNFKLTIGGYISGLSGLTAGTLYYVQATGVLSTSVTQLPYLIAANATDGFILAGGGGSQTLTQVLTTGNDAGGLGITNVLDPVNPQDAATKAWATAYVATAVANLIDSSPATLDTLNELAAALGDDPNFATTVTTQLGLKAPLASPALTGNPTTPTQAVGNNSTRIASTAYVVAEIASRITALLSDQTNAETAADATLGNRNNTNLFTARSFRWAFDKLLTVTNTVSAVWTFSVAPIVPTQAVGDSSTKAASTAFVAAFYNWLLNYATTITATTDTLNTARAGNKIRYNVSSDVTVTIPTNATDAIPIGSRYFLRRSGTGNVIVSPAVGVTINAPNTILQTYKQYGEIYLTKSGTDTWELFTEPGTFWEWLKLQATEMVSLLTALGIFDSRTTVTISASTLTLDMNSERFGRFVMNATSSADFTIAFSNTTNMIELEVWLILTGTRAITLPSGTQMQLSEKDGGRWNDSTRVLTLAAATGSYYKLVIGKSGSVYLADSSARYL